MNECGGCLFCDNYVNKYNGAESLKSVLLCGVHQQKRVRCIEKMSGSSFDAWLSKIEAEEYYEYPFTVVRYFAGVRNLAEERGESEIIQNMDFEIDAFELQINNPFLEKYTRRFEERIDTMNEAQVTYYLKRYSESTNDQLRYRYADILIDYRGEHHRKVNKYDLFKGIIPVIISVSEKHLKFRADPQHEVFRCLSRGVELAISYKNEEFVGLLANYTVEQLRLIKDRGEKYRWALEGLEILRGVYSSRFQSLISSDAVADCLALLNLGAEEFREENNHHLQRAFLAEKISWLKALQRGEDEVTQVQLEIGNSFEEESEIQQGRESKSNLVKAHFLELALKHYAEIGESEKVEKMKVAIRESYIASRSEFKEIRVEMQMSQEAVKEIQGAWEVYRGLSAEDILNSMVIDKNLIPDLDRVELLTKQQQETFVLQSLFSSGVVTDGKKVFQPTNDEEKHLMKLNENYVRNIDFILSYLLIPIIDISINEKGLASEFVVKKLTSWPYLLENNARIIEAGIKSYFSGDYVSSLHILVPQLEACVRNLFAQAGYATTSIKKGLAQHEITFNEFLKNEDVISVLGKAYHKYLQVVMVEQTGLNLRNEIAHGLINIESCNKATCSLILYLLLSITRYSISE